MKRGTRSSQERPISVRGASGDPARGSYCTPKYVADALPDFDLDPFTNERSHIRARETCILARGDNGYGSGDAGSFLLAGGSQPRYGRATSSTRVWIQPDYSDTLRAVRHYLHTRFIALLKWDLRPEWSDLIGGASEWIGHLSNSPGRSSFEFEAPPGITGAGNSWPHSLYARHYSDVTPAMRVLCSYPDGTAHHHRKRSALDGPGAARWISQWGLDASLFNLSTKDDSK